MDEDLISSFIEVDLKNDDNFLKVKETLTRIGIGSRRKKCLWQSCHVLHKRGRYYIVHFKEMYALDGRKTDFSTEDIQRRNTIAQFLENWELLEILNKEVMSDGFVSSRDIMIISYKEKDEWELLPKYNIGRK